MVFKTKGGEIFQVGCEELVIIVTGSKPYDDACWAEYVGICRRSAEPRPFKVVLNYSPVLGPSASQRAKFTHELRDLIAHFQRTALVTDSSFVRGALTAASWLSREGNMQLKPYAPNRVDEALAWLQQAGKFDVAAAKAAFLDLVRQQGDDPIGLLKSR
jgi:hypothetical protein